MSLQLPLPTLSESVPRPLKPPVCTGCSLLSVMRLLCELPVSLSQKRKLVLVLLMLNHSVTCRT